jgi:hypothetical protein
MRREMSPEVREMPEPTLAIAGGAVTFRVILCALSELFSAERPTIRTHRRSHPVLRLD